MCVCEEGRGVRGKMDVWWKQKVDAKEIEAKKKEFVFVVVRVFDVCVCVYVKEGKVKEEE